MKYSRNSLTPAYALAIIGDFNLSLLQVLNILYGVLLGAAPWQNGIIGGGYGLSYLVMAAVLGRLGDKMPRKNSLFFALIGQLGVSLYYIFIASTVWLLVIGQIALGCAYGFYWPAIEAHISENSNSSSTVHRKAISNFCISWSIGYMIGPFVAGVFSDIAVIIGFIIVFIAYTFGFFIMMMFIPKQNNRTHKPKIEQILKIRNEEPKTSKKMDTFLIRILFGMLIYAMLGKIVLVYFADYASRSDGLALSGTLVGVILFSYGIGRTIYFFISRRIKSSLKRLNYSYLIVAIFLILIALLNVIELIFIIILCFGVFSGLIYKSSLELLLESEEEAKGAKAGLFESAIGVGSASSPIIAGLLAEIILILPFFVYSSIALIVFLINIALERKLRD